MASEDSHSTFRFVGQGSGAYGRLSEDQFVNHTLVPRFEKCIQLKEHLFFTAKDLMKNKEEINTFWFMLTSLQIFGRNGLTNLD